MPPHTDGDGRSASASGDGPEAAVRPLRRGLAVLRAMSAPGTEHARRGDLVRATGLARSTVDRVVATLDALGYLRTDGREVALAPPLMELGNAYLTADGLSDALAPYVDQLADTVDESVSLAVPDGDAVRFIAQATRRRTMSLAFRIGDALPAERGAPGALFTAAWGEEEWDAWRSRKAADPHDEGFTAVPPRADAGTAVAASEADFRRRAEESQRRGWSLDDQLIEPGLVAMCVPVRRPDGTTACALSLVSHTSRNDAGRLADRFLPELRAVAGRMETALAAPPTPPAPPVPPPVPAGNGTGAAEQGPAEHKTARPAERSGQGAGFLQSLARGLAVLRALEHATGDGLPLAAVAETAGLSRATARRCLLTLEQLGYVAHRGRFFRPRPRLLELGYPQLGGLGFGEIVRPHLRRLVDRVHQSASVTVLDGEEISYVARVHTTRVMSVTITLGTRFPAYATAMGRVLLAGLPDGERRGVLDGSRPRPLTPHTVTALPDLAAAVERVDRAGYAVVDDELEVGLRSVAVPLRAGDGRVVAAVNVAQHSGREPADETCRTVLPLLRETAAAIETDVRTVGRHLPLRVP